MTLSLSNWDYYLVLERELVNSFNYVELSNDNFSTYSVEFAKMLLSICSEFDSVLKIMSNFDPEIDHLISRKHSSACLL